VIAQHPNTSYAWCDPFQSFEPLSTDAIVDARKASHIVAKTIAELDAAHRRVAETFDELIAAPSRLNRVRGLKKVVRKNAVTPAPTWTWLFDVCVNTPFNKM
jgi:hypothetical protein